MSKFKKIFMIIACSFIFVIGTFLITISNIKSNVGIAVGSPYTVVVFNHSTTGREIKDESLMKEFNDEMKKLTNVSVYDKLVNGVSLSKNIQVDSNGKLSKYSSDLLNENIVIEIIYNTIQDLVVYDGKDTRVISYFCISFVIPTTNNFTEIPVYYSITSNTQDAEKEKSYMENTPLILTGNAKSFEKFVEKLKSN